VVRYWPPTNSFLLFGVLTSVPILVKIDQEMRPWECPQTDKHTHTHTHTDRQTQTDFIICPMLYAIAMGQIITTTIKQSYDITKPACAATILALGGQISPKFYHLSGHLSYMNPLQGSLNVILFPSRLHDATKEPILTKWISK